MAMQGLPSHAVVIFWISNKISFPDDDAAAEMISIHLECHSLIF